MTTNPPTYTGLRPGRPALDRYRFDLVVAIELGAEDYDDAEARAEALLAELRPRLARAIRNHRKGSPELVVADTLTDSIAAV